MNKKGSIADIFVFMALGLGILLILGIMLYGFRVIDDNMGVIGGDMGDKYGTLGNISNQTVGVVVDSFDGFKLIVFAFFFGMILSIFITGFFVRSHPVFFLIYLFVMVLAVIVAVPLSNFYEDLITPGNTVFGETLTEFTASNFIMVNLPLWVGIIGIMGAVFLFIYMKTSPGEIGTAI